MKKVFEFTIAGRLPGLNEYTAACRGKFGNRMGNLMKRREEQRVHTALLAQNRPQCDFAYPVYIHYVWTEKDRRRDLDNIAGFGHKVIQDALVKAGVLENDGWKHIAGFRDEFEVDKNNPHVKVEIWEQEE